MVGLQLCYGKTKVPCNKFARECDHRTTLKVQGHAVDVLPEDGTTKDLSRALRLDLHDHVEIRNRINIAWRRFIGLKRELCQQAVPTEVTNATFRHNSFSNAALWSWNLESDC